MTAKLNTEEFIRKAIIVHEDLYDYSLVKYTDSKKKVEVICKTHGIFSIAPSDHLYGKQGCRECGKLLSITGRKYTTEDFIKKAIDLHGDLYDYSLVEYKHNRSKVKIICKTHGVFEQSPNSHLQGQGCRYCGILSNAILNRKTTEDFINEAIVVHGDSYDYSEVVYKSSREKVKIICKTHGIFEQVANSHINGHGCKLCFSALSGFNKTRFVNLVNKKGFGVLYVVNLYNESESFVKIGLTTQTIDRRAMDFPYKTQILHEELLSNGCIMFDLEKYLHSVFKMFRYKPLIEFAGSTECFNNIAIDEILSEINNFKENHEQSTSSS